MMSNNLIAIYDFEFFPYALGDVLTWNIRTAMRCEELRKNLVDIYICVDEKNPASIYQRGLVNPDNFDLFFSELYGAFGTNPKLGNIFIFRKRQEMIAHLQNLAAKDEGNLEALADYFSILKSNVPDQKRNQLLQRLKQKIKSYSRIMKLFHRFVPQKMQDTVRKNISTEYILNQYFIKYIYSHEEINQFVAKNGYVPSLKPSLGCTPDVDEICGRQFKDKKIVPFHLRLRRLDVGYGGDHSYDRDSNFLEWYDFLRRAGEKYPEVQFVALGRLQEKPLEILRLPNVTSLRIHGMGLGHELTLMLRSDLFIGSSSGFAALANFSKLPYFITRMNPGSCHAYAIPEGAKQLPFAEENQKLIYETESSELLMSLLERGLGLRISHLDSLDVIPAQAGTYSANGKIYAEDKWVPACAGMTTKESESETSKVQIDIQAWLAKRMQQINPAATTSRFYINDEYRHEESAYLLLPYIEQARQAYLNNEKEIAFNLFKKIQLNFPELCKKIPEYLLLQDFMSIDENRLPTEQVLT